MWICRSSIFFGMPFFFGNIPSPVASTTFLKSIRVVFLLETFTSRGCHNLTFSIFLVWSRMAGPWSCVYRLRTILVYFLTDYWGLLRITEVYWGLLRFTEVFGAGENLFSKVGIDWFPKAQRGGFQQSPSSPCSVPNGTTNGFPTWGSWVGTFENSCGENTYQRTAHTALRWARGTSLWLGRRWAWTLRE